MRRVSFLNHTEILRELQITLLACLVVFFASSYEGGELLVRHHGQEKRFDFSKAFHKPNEFPWVAFYTVCEHEILPVTSGFRITLTFNIYFKKDSVEPLPPLSDTELANKIRQKMVDILLNESFGQKYNSVSILLSHQYSIATLAPSTLKGTDLLIYQTLTSGLLNKDLLKYTDEYVSVSKYAAATIPYLKILLEKRGLKKSGKKQELIDRLEEYDKRQEEAKNPPAASTSNVYTSASTSSSTPLPPVVKIDLKSVVVDISGQAGGDEGLRVKDIIEECLSEGMHLRISDPATGTSLVSLYYSGRSGRVSEVEESVYVLFGFAGLKYDRPKRARIQGTGNE